MLGGPSWPCDTLPDFASPNPAHLPGLQLGVSTLALMVSRDSLDAPLARTFGKAKWLLLWEGANGAEFRRNETLSGRSVAGTIAAAGCRDVIAAHLGEKACAHLSALGIRLWRGPDDAPVRDVIEMHLRGQLSQWSAGVGPATRPIGPV